MSLHVKYQAFRPLEYSDVSKFLSFPLNFREHLIFHAVSVKKMARMRTSSKRLKRQERKKEVKTGMIEPI
jgi:hypothetical protein